jgi:DNA adenine methylase
MNDFMKYISPLRYPGGKAKLAEFFKFIIEENNLLDGVYVEPYAGGAAVALTLLMDEYVNKIIINDKDKSIYAFWHSVLQDTDRLCRLISDTPVTMDIWYKEREIQKHKKDAELLELGFSTLFMNRTNRSGIIKAGVIGGYSQTGNYKIDARFNKKDLLNRIERIADYSDRINLFNLDAIDLLAHISESLPEKSILYLDPPYYKKGQGLYMNYYDDSDHETIREVMTKEKNLIWIVSYDNSPFIKSLYANFRSQEFYLNYSANNNGKGKEVMFFSDNCKVTPEALSKINISEPC